MDASAAGPLEERMAAALARLAREDAVGQLRRRDGAMARLGSEGGALKLDWVEAIPWLLAHPEALASVEAEARALLAAGARHIIWAGMGGSVLAVRVLCALGYGAGALTIHPLDSTDPAALNAIVRDLAAARGMAIPAKAARITEPETLRALLGDVGLVAVALGMTSEEPITHLAWMTEALGAAGLPLAERLRAMSLPGSYLDAYAREHAIPRLPLQPDGGSGTGGRMSAPGTRVFLLPVALWLAAQGAAPGALAGVLRQAWAAYDLDAAQTRPAEHPYVRLAATLAAASVDGAARLVIAAPGPWDTLRDWAEQLFEESLGKGGEGVMVFGVSDSPLASREREYGREVSLRITGDPAAPDTPGVFTLREPLIASPDPLERLAGLAALMLGLQLTMALYGWLEGITFAGQPAVEDYKARARTLRDAGADPVPALTSTNCRRDGPLTILAPERLIAGADGDGAGDAARLVTQAVAALRASDLAPLPYLDLTINGEAEPGALAPLAASLRALAVERLGVACKLRRAPAAYHSTEQSEMDGPPWLVSIRALALRQEPSLLGDYPPTFLRAQAVATWQAMNAAGRPCLLLLYDGEAPAMLAALTTLLDDVARRLG